MEYICMDCPRKCGAKRSDTSAGGVCASPAVPLLARAAPHFGEEPCISGTRGSGAVFFTGCSLKCVFCQNREISRGKTGTPVTLQGFRELLLRLQDSGVHNINLVTPSHFTRFVAEALSGLSLEIPVVWNSSGYESAETLRMLEGLVQVYMPDLKYMLKEPAKRYSGAEDYPERAAEAISEMYRQTGPYRLDEDGILQQGVLIRHLMLPDNALNTMEVLDFIEKHYPKGTVLFSLMSQYTPMPWVAEARPELNRCLTERESEAMYRYMLRCGITDGYYQDTAAATTELLPAFDGTGV